MMRTTITVRYVRNELYVEFVRSGCTNSVLVMNRSFLYVLMNLLQLLSLQVDFSMVDFCFQMKAKLN